jgi:threonine synthase
MKKTKNSTPSSEWESKDRCPSCGSFCDIHLDLDENDECNDCRSIKTAVEYILNLVVGEDEQGKDVRVKDTISKSEIAKAKEMEKQEKIEFACKVYNENYLKDKSFRKIAEELIKSE